MAKWSSTYMYKGKHYKIIDPEASMKHPVTGEWIPCIAYCAINGVDLYVREKSDFDNKFKEV